MNQIIVLFQMKIVTVLFLLFLTITIGTSSSSSSINSNIHLLDNTGHAIQLKHAQAASDVHGRTIIVINVYQYKKYIQEQLTRIRQERRQQEQDELQQNEDEQEQIQERKELEQKAGDDMNDENDLDDEDDLVWVVSLLDQKMQQQRRHLRNDDSCTTTTNNLVQPLTNLNTNNNNYAICNGVYGDAIWFLRQLQTYVRIINERYNTQDTGSSSAVSHVIPMASIASFLLRTMFWGYDHSSDNDSNIPWIGYGARTLLSEMENQGGSSSSSSWSRPIGIRTILISTNSNSDNNKVMIQLVEPTGIVSNVDSYSCCVGKYSSLLQDEIETKLIDALIATENDDDNTSTNNHRYDYKELLEQILFDVISKHIFGDDASASATDYNQQQRQDGEDNNNNVRNQFDLYIERIASDGKIMVRKSTKKQTKQLSSSSI